MLGAQQSSEGTTWGGLRLAVDEWVQAAAGDKRGENSSGVEGWRIGYFVAGVDGFGHEAPGLVARVLASCAIEKIVGGGALSLSYLGSRT
jgi:hypothetical protein